MKKMRQDKKSSMRIVGLMFWGLFVYNKVFLRKIDGLSYGKSWLIMNTMMLLVCILLCCFIGKRRTNSNALSPILLARMEESNRFCFLTVKGENKMRILDDYFCRYKLTITEEEKEQILVCLEEHSVEQWPRLLNSAVIYLYQKDSELDVDTLRKKIMMSEKHTIGFHA